MAGIRIDSECEIKLKIVSSKFYLILHVFQKFTKYFKNEKINKHSGNIPKLKCTDLKKIGNLKSRYFDVSEKIFFQRGC